MIEADLMKHYTSQRAEHVMRILRAYHSVGTHQQQEADAVTINFVERFIHLVIDLSVYFV